jgi:hypothetical protein
MSARRPALCAATVAVVVLAAALAALPTRLARAMVDPIAHGELAAGHAGHAATAAAATHLDARLVTSPGLAPAPPRPSTAQAAPARRDRLRVDLPRLTVAPKTSPPVVG